MCCPWQCAYLHSDLYKYYGRVPPNERAHASREGVIGSKESYTIQLYTTLDDDPPIIAHIHDKRDPSDGDLYVDFQAKYTQYNLKHGDLYH